MNVKWRGAVLAPVVLAVVGVSMSSAPHTAVSETKDPPKRVLLPILPEPQKHAGDVIAELPTTTTTVAPTTTTTTTQPVSTTTTTAAVAQPVDLVPPDTMAAWEKVAMCEEGGNWHVRGSVYSGGLGISNTNWVAYGGTQFAYSAADATPEQQVLVAERIQSSPPDQYGCAAW